MTDIHISEFLKTRTQKEVAQIMGVTQGAVHQAVAADRNIYFVEKAPGVFEHYEIKKPRAKKAA